MKTKEELIYLRPFRTNTDAVARQERSNKTQWAVYLHRWPSGSQTLVFQSTADAQRFAQSNDAAFTGPKKDRARKEQGHRSNHQERIAP